MEELLKTSLYDLKAYLKDHEQDILENVNDFGDLRDVFWDVIGRYPEKKSPN